MAEVQRSNEGLLGSRFRCCVYSTAATGSRSMPSYARGAARSMGTANVSGSIPIAAYFMTLIMGQLSKTPAARSVI